MLKQNSELRAQAREALRGKWPMAAVAALIYSAIAGWFVFHSFYWMDRVFVGRTACCIRLCYFDAGCIQRSGRG